MSDITRTRVTQVTRTFNYREGTQDEIVAVLKSQGWHVHDELSGQAGGGMVGLVHPQLEGTVQWVDPTSTVERVTGD